MFGKKCVQKLGQLHAFYTYYDPLPSLSLASSLPFPSLPSPFLLTISPSLPYPCLSFFLFLSPPFLSNPFLTFLPFPSLFTFFLLFPLFYPFVSLLSSPFFPFPLLPPISSPFHLFLWFTFKCCFRSCSNSQFTFSKIKLTIYNSLFRSHLEYCIHTWGGK